MRYIKMLSYKECNSIEVIYFDLDDTLCAYWNAVRVGLRRTFEQYGPRDFTVDQMIQAWAKRFPDLSTILHHSSWYPLYLQSGDPTRIELMRMTLEEFGIHDLELAEQLSKVYRIERNAALKLFPDAMAVLQNLSKQYPLGLLTNGPKDIQREEIETLGIEKYFKHILIEGEFGEGKPSLSFFEKAQELVNVEPAQILMVGNDYKNDIFPAIKMGWQTVWIRRESDVPVSAGPHGKPFELPYDAPSPDVIIENLSELVAGSCNSYFQKHGIVH